MVEVVTDSLPFLHLSTECHCPPSHPLTNPQNEANCIQHQEEGGGGGDLVLRGTVGRLNSQSHPVGHINDLSSVFEWISSPGVRNVNVTINLTTSLYEVSASLTEYLVPRPPPPIYNAGGGGGDDLFLLFSVVSIVFRRQYL